MPAHGPLPGWLQPPLSAGAQLLVLGHLQGMEWSECASSFKNLCYSSSRNSSTSNNNKKKPAAPGKIIVNSYKSNRSSEKYFFLKKTLATTEVRWDKSQQHHKKSSSNNHAKSERPQWLREKQQDSQHVLLKQTAAVAVFIYTVYGQRNILDYINPSSGVPLHPRCVQGRRRLRRVP